MFRPGVGTCGQDTCANQGTCDRVSASCDCDLTSFTGPRCTDGKRIHAECSILHRGPIIPNIWVRVKINICVGE